RDEAIRRNRLPPVAGSWTTGIRRGRLTSAAYGPSPWGTLAFAPGGQGGPVQAALHRLLGNPDHRGRLGMRQPLDADQVEYSRSFSGRPSIAPSVRRPSGLRPEAVLTGGAATAVSVSAAAAGCLSRRRARSMSCLRMCWLASAKNRRTVGGRVVR